MLFNFYLGCIGISEVGVISHWSHVSRIWMWQTNQKQCFFSFESIIYFSSLLKQCYALIIIWLLECKYISTSYLCFELLPKSMMNHLLVTSTMCCENRKLAIQLCPWCHKILIKDVPLKAKTFTAKGLSLNLRSTSLLLILNAD